jgi:spermidine synthase
MTQEFLEEVRTLLGDRGVVAANTFAISDLYDHESVTYAAVFPHFFNMKINAAGNRVILASTAPLPDRAQLEQRAAALAPALARYGIDFDELLPLMSTDVDWDTEARVLTDQYAPANLLQSR